MPKQEWDVSDAKKLRRVIGSVNDFETEDYYEYWVTPSAHYTDGTRGTSNSAIENIGFATGVDEWARSNIRSRTNWIRGQVEVTSFFRGNTYASQAARLIQRVRGATVGSATVTGILERQWTETLPTTNLEVFSSTISGTANTNRYDLLGLSVERAGTHVDDTYAQDLDYLGSLVRWKRAAGR